MEHSLEAYLERQTTVRLYAAWRSCAMSERERADEEVVRMIQKILSQRECDSAK